MGSGSRIQDLGFQLVLLIVLRRVVELHPAFDVKRYDRVIGP